MMDAVLHYVDEFEREKALLPGNENPGLNQLRQKACDDLLKLGFPTQKNENWKYTTIHSKVIQPFTSSVDQTLQRDQTWFSTFQIDQLPCYTLVFYNGIFSPDFSCLEDLDYSSVTQGTLFQENEFEHHDAFLALNSALMRDGFHLFVKENKVLKKPIHIFHVTTQKNLMTNTRNIIHLHPGAEATVIEHYIGVDERPYFSNTQTFIYLAKQSTCTHYKLQQQGNKAFHIDRLHVKQEKNSQFCAYSFSMGGELVRSDTQVKGDDEDTLTALYGLYVGKNKQHTEHHTLITHSHPNNQSRQLYKGILDHQATGVFCGRIEVKPTAKKTDAHQYNRNLLLSSNAAAVSQPELAIEADDVQCRHGATVGHLDEHALFYLQTRALSYEEAKQLLVDGFAGEILEKINLPPIKDKLKDILYGE